MKQHEKYINVVINVLSCWFIVLCTAHLIQQRPLWNDELAVFESVEKFSASQMFGEPLRAFQVFPRAYLFGIQQFSKHFDFSIWSLRFPSYICMIIGFLIWLKIARIAIKDPWQRLAFVGSWVASGLLLYYSAELKPYSMDVMVAAIFILFLYHQKKLQNTCDKRYVWMLAGLPLLGFCSYPAFIMMMLPLYNVFRSSFKCKVCRMHLSVYVLSMAVVIGLSYQYDMRLRPLTAVTEGFGDYFISFASVGDFFQTFGEGANNLFSRWFVERPKYFKSLTRIFTGFALIYMFYGYFKYRKREDGYFRSLDSIGLVVFFGLFLMGCVQKYPFTVPRTSLFYAPIVLYMTARGIRLADIVHVLLYRLIMLLYFIFLGFLIVMQSFLAFLGQLGFYPSLWQNLPK